MDLIKAQRLLHKIQAFIDNDHGQELSRLEKDLVKSYITQLYDAVVSEEHVSHDLTEPKKQREESPSMKEPLRSVEYVKPEIKPEVKVREHEVIHREVTPPQERIVKEEIPAPQVKWQPPVEETKRVVEKEPVKQPVDVRQESGQQDELLQKLFESQKPEDVSHRFGHVPIPSIESAMGLNERIFTLNELFGGDKALFDSTCARLNNLSSFNEAKNILMQGPAREYKWAEPARIKMAEQFLRIVARKYPKQVS